IEGRIVDRTGRELGRHAGVEGFTVGQRRRLGIAAASPLYVQAIEGANVVVAATPPRSAALLARRWNWLVDPSELAGTVLVAQLRSRHLGVAVLVDRAEEDHVRLRFPEPAIAVAPGQAAVVYRGDEVVGGGWIERAEAAVEAAA
ncbi:MAG: aminomethyltransferase beta-barrel domain-containing protein, partial [Candidatus Binatia bacterium]